MKTILAPVDFSEASANALLFAAELSKRASARLVVVNILEKNEEEKEKVRVLHLVCAVGAQGMRRE